ncbi:hypothetical protein NADFUDRAFT_43678 [Nadsonia fulvescens var. elongata DSM 6958]|uniref:Zn(2)-C6 fungal-type domain-containing protein n=1 Tax=Nadsonia fulvescens var. elongata DSM 6958 TaxID=857566 RepID=A0A1E3PGJ3_9ASCO|nr:hypothetical protein NADFUDRAFT_43678 [Nadsonia fulvescens var. elongata DSM 6958]
MPPSLPQSHRPPHIPCAETPAMPDYNTVLSELNLAVDLLLQTNSRPKPNPAYRPPNKPSYHAPLESLESPDLHFYNTHPAAPTSAQSGFVPALQAPPFSIPQPVESPRKLYSAHSAKSATDRTPALATPSLKDGRKRRTSRACDRCNKLRTKCDGKKPCQHCVGLNLVCEYLRTPLPRGKASLKYLKGMKNTNAKTANSLEKSKVDQSKPTKNKIAKYHSSSIPSSRNCWPPKTFSTNLSSSWASSKERTQFELNQKQVASIKKNEPHHASTKTLLQTPVDLSFTNKDSTLSALSPSPVSFHSPCSSNFNCQIESSPDVIFADDSFDSPPHHNIAPFTSSSSLPHTTKPHVTNNTQHNGMVSDNSYHVGPDAKGCSIANTSSPANNELSLSLQLGWPKKMPYSQPSKSDALPVKLAPTDNLYSMTGNENLFGNFPPSPPSGPDHDFQLGEVFNNNKHFNLTSDGNYLQSFDSDWYTWTASNEDLDLSRSNLLLNFPYR